MPERGRDRCLHLLVFIDRILAFVTAAHSLPQRARNSIQPLGLRLHYSMPRGKKRGVLLSRNKSRQQYRTPYRQIINATNLIPLNIRGYSGGGTLRSFCSWQTLLQHGAAPCCLFLFLLVQHRASIHNLG